MTHPKVLLVAFFSQVLSPSWSCELTKQPAFAPLTQAGFLAGHKTPNGRPGGGCQPSRSSQVKGKQICTHIIHGALKGRRVKWPMAPEKGGHRDQI